MGYCDFKWIKKSSKEYIQEKYIDPDQESRSEALLNNQPITLSFDMNIEKVTVNKTSLFISILKQINQSISLLNKTLNIDAYVSEVPAVLNMLNKHFIFLSQNKLQKFG